MSKRTDEDFALFGRALQYYSQRLQNLKKDEDIQNGNSIIKRDLERSSKLALEVADLLDDYKSENVTHDNVEMLKSALKLYKQDLIDSGKNLREKLSVDIELNNVDDEVKHIDRVVHNRDWE